MDQQTEDNILGYFKGIKINSIAHVGGEPSNDLNALDELFSALQRNETQFYHFGIMTNGSNPSREFFDSVDRISSLAIAHPEFPYKVSMHRTKRRCHREEHERLGLDYEENSTKFDDMIAKYPHFNNIVSLSPEYANIIVKCGNAANPENSDYLDGLDEKIIEPISIRQQLAFQRYPNGYLALDSIKFDARGNILPNNEGYTSTDYITEERENLGNINTGNLTNIMIKHGELEIIH